MKAVLKAPWALILKTAEKTVNSLRMLNIRVLASDKGQSFAAIPPVRTANCQVVEFIYVPIIGERQLQLNPSGRSSGGDTEEIALDMKRLFY